MQYKLNYVTYTRSTLAFTHKTIDDMLSKFDDGNTTAIYNNKNNRKPAIEILGKKFYLKRKRKIRDVVIVPPVAENMFGVTAELSALAVPVPAVFFADTLNL